MTSDGLRRRRGQDNTAGAAADVDSGSAAAGTAQPTTWSVRRFVASMPFANSQSWTQSSFVQRSVSMFVLCAVFGGIIRLGHVACAVLVLVVIAATFVELLTQSFVEGASTDERSRRLPKGFFNLRWYFLIVALYYAYGRVVYRMQTILQDPDFARLSQYHPFVVLMLYMFGFMMFVGYLRKGSYRYQYKLFAWVHMVLFLIVSSSNFFLRNIFEGLFWFIFPASLVIVNDTMAYLFGKTMGATLLIPDLSPKKTVEGFVGALFSTLIFAFFFSGFLGGYPHMICPKRTLDFAAVSCDPFPWFQVSHYLVPARIVTVLRMFGLDMTSIAIRPIQMHSLALGLFVSIVAPFGGFFASGIKRAFKIKDFGDLIPGHGGVTDRMDCQFITGVFTLVYYTTFIKPGLTTVVSLLAKIAALTDSDLLDLHSRIGEVIATRGLA